jgi:predicted metal-dependent HD superfamily phosphohydrolase
MNLDKSLAYIGASIAAGRNWRAAMSEPHRHYHTLAHVEAMLSHIPEGAESRELVAAIWLHDIVYDPTAGDNEERSADRAMEDLKYTPLDRDMVAGLIIGTKLHEGGSDIQNLLNDLDLGILGASRTIYATYCEQIRDEYRNVPDKLYSQGRTAILKRFNERHLFKTAFFQHLEKPAHANLEWEIRMLTA